MSNFSLLNKKRLFVKSSGNENNPKKKKLDNVNSTLLNFNDNSTDNIADSFENLCKQKCINDEKSLKIFDDIAVTGKIFKL